MEALFYGHLIIVNVLFVCFCCFTNLHYWSMDAVVAVFKWGDFFLKMASQPSKQCMQFMLIMKG